MKHWTEIDETQLRQMRASGMRSREIADELGVPSPMVLRACKEWDIPSPLGANASRNSPRQGGKNDADWRDAAERASQALARAIHKHHPERRTA